VVRPCDPQLKPDNFRASRLQVGDQQSTRISDRNLEAKAVCRLRPRLRLARWHRARIHDWVAGLNPRRQGFNVLSGGPGGMALHLSRICPSNSRSRLAHCCRRHLCFPIPPASEPVPAVPANACNAGPRRTPRFNATSRPSAALDIEHRISPQLTHLPRHQLVRRRISSGCQLARESWLRQIV